jgi:hypothetical protein
VFVKDSPGRAFAVRVTDIHAPRSMTWVGGMPFGLFSGTRVFELTASPAADRAVFSMRETYGGPLSGVIAKSIPNLQPAFDEFAQCLKREAERR